MPEPRRERPKQPAREVRPAPAYALARDAQTRNASVSLAAPIGIRGVAALQRQAGNRAAARLLSGSRGREVALQRAAACPAPPVAPEAVAPTDDHRFVAVTGAVGKIASSQQAHPPAGAKVAEAQQAAVPPANEAAAQAGASQVGKMNEAEAGTFDKAAFIAAVAKAIDAASPKTLDDADKLKDSGKAAEVKEQVSGLVTKGKDDSAQDIKSATEAPPDTSAANPKPVTPMPAEDAGQPPAPPAADGAVPAPRGPDQTNLGYGPCGLDGKMADAKVTDEQLAKGNESRFDQALDAKQKVQQNAATAPGPVRAAESQQLAAAQAGATATVAGGVAGMHAARGAALGGVGGHKSDAKAADEAKRAEISKHIEDVFTATKTDVTKMLDGLDADVGKAFDDGEKAAREAFNTNVGTEMDAWKDQRYSGVSGAAQWVADQFTGAPPEVSQIFARNRARYLADMQQVISTVADLVGATLTKAKQRIADGQAEVKAYVASQPAALRQFAAEAGSKIAGQFASLRNDVAAKQDAVVGDLAQKYVAARKSVDDAITKMQEENKGLVQEAESAVEGAIDTIEKLRDWVENTAQRIASSVDRILEDPISFVGKLLTAVKTGFGNFMSNIVEHLEQGFKEFLFGTLAEAGITLPETFDLKGIFQLVLSVFGITYEHVKARILQKLGPKAAKIWHLIEQGITIIKTIAEKGLSGVWDMLMDKVQGIKDMIVDGIKSFVIQAVVKKGIEWLLSLFNPAGAFVEAVELIIDVVQFFIQKGKQIQETIDRILDSVESLLNGGEGGVPALIEQSLAKAVPTVITFLADLVGLGDLGTTLQGLVKKAQSITDTAIDWLVDHAIGLVKAAWGAIAGQDDKDESPEEKARRLDEGLSAAVTALNQHAGTAVTASVLNEELAPIRSQYKFSVLEVVPQDNTWAVHGVINPDETRATGAKKSEADPAKVQAAIKQAESAYAKASDQYKNLADPLRAKGTQSAAEEADRLTVASDGEVFRTQGGRTQENLEAGQNAPDLATQQQAGQAWLEADSARWAAAKAVTGSNLNEMLELTPAAEKALAGLNKDNPEDAEKIDAIMRRPGSYKYPGVTRAEREASYAKTGAYIPRRSPQDMGVPGATSSVHAEKLLRSATGAQAIGVSRPQCADCQLWFKEAAASAGDFIVVFDGAEVRIFMPDNSVKGPADFQ